MRGLAERTYTESGVSRRMWPSDPVDLLQALYPPLYAAAVKLVRGRDAEDLVQDTILEVLVRHPNFEGVSHPLGYTKTVLVRLASRRFRNITPTNVPVDVFQTLEQSPIEDWETRVAGDVDLQRAIRRLPPAQRACVYLRFVEGLDDQQIASILGSKPSTVRAHVSRAVRRLGVMWANEPKEEE